MKNPVVSHLPHSLPRTGIMVTIGSTNSGSGDLLAMANEGATIFRFNAAQFLNKEHGPFAVPLRGSDSGRPVIEVVATIRRIEVDLRRPLLTYLDLAGPKLRVDEVRGGHDHPQLKDTFRIYLDHVDNDRRATANCGDACLVFVRDALHERFRPNGGRGQVSFKDGKLVVDIVHQGKDELGGYFEGHVTKAAEDFRWKTTDGKRGANVGCNPVGYQFERITTDYDEKVIEWAVHEGLDVLSQSFVCHPIDAFRLRCIIARHVRSRGLPVTRALTWPLVGKVETAPAVLSADAAKYAAALESPPADKMLELLRDYGLSDVAEFRSQMEKFRKLFEVYVDDPLVALSEAFDGLMVARGDLAVEIPKVEVPNAQRRLVSECRLRSKSVIIATEVLPSMQHGLPSTRAEIGDINTAVFQEADVIMLGGEVATLETTDYGPADVVAELRSALLAAERERKNIDSERNFEERQGRMQSAALLPDSVVKRKISMGARVCNAARSGGSPAIFASVTSGATAAYISNFSPPQPVVAITGTAAVARALLLHQGVYPVQVRREYDDRLESLVDILREAHGCFVRDGTWPSAETMCPTVVRIGSVAGTTEPQGLARGGGAPNSLCEIVLPETHCEPAETERKYVLGSTHYERLRKALLARYTCDIRSQFNSYFSDHARGLSKAEIALRLRHEESVAGEGDSAVFLTWKAPPRAPAHADVGGFEMRPEVEYDVTSLYYQWKVAGNHSDFKDFSVQDIPVYWPAIRERSKAYGVQIPDTPNETRFELVGRLCNERLTALTESGVRLELDKWSAKWDTELPKNMPADLFNERFELEIEDREENAKKVNEVIHDLFASLDIPVLNGKTPKIKFALLRSGKLLVDSMRDEIRRIEATDEILKTAKGHLESCADCRDILVAGAPTPL